MPNAVTEQVTSPGLAAPQRLAVEPPARHQPGAERLDQHVGAAGELARERDVAGVAEVERQRALVAVEPEVVGRLAVALRRPPGARVVAAVGPLDLDHVGAEVAEQHRGERARRARARSRRRGCRRAAPWGRHTNGVRTLVISDLHIGAASGKDLLRRADLRAPLIERAARRRPARDPRRRARAARGARTATRPSWPAPFFAEAGAALGPDGELLVLAGNHDHGLVAGWIDARLQSEPSGFLGLSEPVEPERGRARSPTRLAELARPARLRLAYPGVWLRDDVYAHPRPLRRPALDGADVRAARRRRDGALGRAAARATARGRTTTRRRSRRSTRSCTSSRSAPTTRRSARAPARRRAPGWRWRGRGGRAIPSARPRWARATSAAVARRQRARARPGRPRPVRRRAAPRRPARDPRGAAAARRHGAARDLRPHAPLRPVAAATTRRSGARPRARGCYNTGSWVYQPHFLSERPNALALLAGHRRRSSRTAGPPRLIRLLGDRGHPELRPPA